MAVDLKWMKQWYSSEMNKTEAELFKKYLFKHNIRYEASDVCHLTHFECYMTEDEMLGANDWITKNIAE